MADDKSTPATAKDIEGAEPQPQPDNVVTDNAGVAPVQPVGTSDPTLDDNTNPKVPFDGADPRNIPPHDSNEQLHIAAEKRTAADMGNLETAAATRRRAVEAAYDNSQDVRDVLPDAEAPGDTRDGGDSDKPKARADASHPSAARSTPPQGRSAKPTSTTAK
jgi:hypothetical protein